ncbi:glycine dehydrogenase (aminomethyl-transferring) [Synchytrium microbalum]|uniref:Glycine cleavage system P protein n=1 Tax=Synchytrium microbalum TaxID=1806994 RepID=A0A507CAW2_9FUNG|nr:glycine dehydrogenase (aminomethyl-transferring) [Synchytrium microbalum]TPX36319.1 glycine dehydrogenase (aminomethyl-transferring) [Synchytrium microbalum]
MLRRVATRTASHVNHLNRLSSAVACQSTRTFAHATTSTKAAASAHLINDSPSHSISFKYPKHADSVFSPTDTFPRRHLGPSESDVANMLSTVGVKDLEELTALTVPAAIRIQNPTRLGPALPETTLLSQLKAIAVKNKVLKSYIGMGYTNTTVPPIILRNIMENPQWYTQASYTPYQPEISQGRLESLINYQTMVADMTGLPIANASLLDEGTAAAEAMLMSFTQSHRKKHIFFVDANCHPQTIACVQTRAEPFGIEVVVGSFTDFDVSKYADTLMGVLVQYPATDGSIVDYEGFVKEIHNVGGLVTVASDLLALALLKPPGEWGADMVLGNAQRFGVPLGYGGPHAAFFAVKDEHKRKMPGRLIGVSKDVDGKPAYRLSLQTREQHIRREKATSNICTAQALLANMSAMYAVYHGPEGIREIAQRVRNLTVILAEGIKELGHTIKNEVYFDTITIKLNGATAEEVLETGVEAGINLRHVDTDHVALTLDETVTKEDLIDILDVFASAPFTHRFKFGYRANYHADTPDIDAIASKTGLTAYDAVATLPAKFARTSAYLQHPVFNCYHSETEMLRYISHLQSKDLSLANAMIPLGSCTMKLNATTEMIPVTWPEFSNIHPFVPADQAVGYKILLDELDYALQEATGFDAISLQPNSGAQGEYAGLRAIRGYLRAKGETNRDICLIPVSAHGTNPASAVMCGMKVVTVKCDELGNLDLTDLEEKATKHGKNLAAIMVTYPSTYGVFEEHIKEVCEIIHSHGGQVYMDGANLNAQMGLCKPGEIGADVCHLNLHKTFCIPHGGGGPGMGPIGVKKHLSPFLPGHPIVKMGAVSENMGPVSAAPWGSASILPISWAYLKMMGDEGLKQATQMALLNANYMARRLDGPYKILYTNKNGMCAHEFIVDIRPFEASTGIAAIDIAKRLHDYGFHSPTMSFPVAGTLMIEPTESESKIELDRFCDAMLHIRQEIADIESGKQPKGNNVLTNAPHPIHVVLSDKWDRPYSRETAAYPMADLRKRKFWPSTSRVDDAYGDRNLICSCPPLEDYE